MATQYNAGSIFAVYASFTAFFTLASQFYHQFIPEKIREYIDEKIGDWFSKRTRLDPKIFTLEIKENFEDRANSGIWYANTVFSACEAYLAHKLRSTSTRLEGCRKDDDDELVSYHLAQGEEYVEYVPLDENNKKLKIRWEFTYKKVKGDKGDDSVYKSFELSFDPQYKDMVLDTFIPSVVVKRYDEMMEMRKDIDLYTYNDNRSSRWDSVSFVHPFTFNALAVDPELKKSIVDDLDRFIKRKEFYKKIGRAWKRGYLLYGPPGTGKSSLIAAIANYLRFNVYDLQIASIKNDFTLRNLMMSISNKSILVIEDIDCASGLSRNNVLSTQYRDDDDNNSNSDDDDDDAARAPANANDNKQISLSGILNFIDGLWSSCGEERIIIITTNHKERLDPALLRPGRMDMHIHMSYLRMPAFRTMVFNYLDLTEHPLFEEIGKLLETTDASPAEIAEELIRNEDPNTALDGVVKMLQQKNKNYVARGQQGDSTVTETNREQYVVELEPSRTSPRSIWPFKCFKKKNKLK